MAGCVARKRVGEGDVLMMGGEARVKSAHKQQSVTSHGGEGIRKESEREYPDLMTYKTKCGKRKGMGFLWLIDSLAWRLIETGAARDGR